MKTTQGIRDSFLQFFELRGHRVMPSSSLVPPEDPTLMFTNAGMVQFKDVFLGTQKPPAPAVATIQKCLRISGKHNDFDQVGFTNRHLTFFEMLGNFSFGKYFKEEAIAYAWEFLTEGCGLKKDRMYATVHLTDQESKDIWIKKIGLPSERIFQFDTDNFWQMADTGPCGPCTEVHYDLGDQFGPVGGDNVVGGTGARFIEIWNLVFMQFQKFPDGTQTKLATPCVDTGMGLERLAMVMQGVTSNFETEELTRIQAAVEVITGVKKNSHNPVNFHVVADHIRSLLFLLHENIFPSNEGRGYVLRRIMRRALRFAGELGQCSNLLSSLLPEVARIYQRPYPGIEKNLQKQVDIVREEEDRFFDVVKRGSGYLDSEITALKQQNVKTIPGDVAFKLHDTYGFPIDLTRVVGKQHGMEVDERAFSQYLERQKEVSRKRDVAEDVFALARHDVARLQKLPATKFVGYESLVSPAVLLDMIQVGDQRIWVFDQTPCYATGGGQIGDVGVITDAVGAQIVRILGTERLSEAVIGHWVESADAKIGSSYVLRVDEMKRADTMAHHTATHLLHKALQVVLGSHVRQMGSYVGPDQLRFDFSHHKKMLEEEKQHVSDWVNQRIDRKIPVHWRVTSIEEAKRSGAMMFFGEKYGSQVRQLAVGDFAHPESLELCGGTHVANTADIGGFEIVSEQSIAQGIRRILALSGSTLIESLKKRAAVGDDIAKSLQVPPDGVLGAVARLQTQSTQQLKALEVLVSELISVWKEKIRQQKEVKFQAFELPAFDLPKKVIKQFSELVVYPETLVWVVYGESQDRRFLLFFGPSWKPQAKDIFEKVARDVGLQGGGGGTQFQGSWPTGMSLENVKKELERYLK